MKFMYDVINDPTQELAELRAENVVLKYEKE